MTLAAMCSVISLTLLWFDLGSYNMYKGNIVMEYLLCLIIFNALPLVVCLWCVSLQSLQPLLTCKQYVAV